MLDSTVATEPSFLYTVSYTDAGGCAARLQLAEGETLIGRAGNCQILIDVPSMSRQHARLRVANGRCTLADAGSRFGTAVNGVPLQGETDLKAGDVFQCGAVAFTLEAAAPAPQVLADDHQLLEDGAIVRPTERRRGRDRRKAQVPFSGPDRRMGRERRQLRFLRLLSEISKTLVAVLPLPQLLSRVADLAFDVIPAERMFVLLRDPGGEAVTARVRRARDGSTPEVSLSRAVITKVMRDRVAMLADDARPDGVRAFMCTPLWNRREVIGVLYADNPREKRFASDDLDVFAALANYAAVAIEQARAAEQLQQEMRTRERLERHYSLSVVDRIVSGTPSADVSFEAQARDVTVMFAGLASFAARCERMTPLEVSKRLDRFFTGMADHVFDFDGTVDKFMGDAVLAVFGAPLAQPDHADRAIDAALAMRRALHEMNEDWPGDPLEMRIALCSGPAFTGEIGTPRRREFTVLGDVVNACSRLESSVCKPGQIVCSRATLDRVTKTYNVKPLDPVNLGGLPSELEVFELD